MGEGSYNKEIENEVIMPKPELTKKLIADTLKKLVTMKHLNKISIAEIVDVAGVNRQTFYYHFRDKQELICWIFDTDIAMLTDKNQNNTLIDDIVEYVYSEKEYYIDALTSEVQNNLREHIYNICYIRCMNEILAILGDEKIDEKAINLFTRFFTNAVTGSLVQWAQEGMKNDIIQFLGNYAPIMKEMLASVISIYVKNDKIKKLY